MSLVISIYYVLLLLFINNGYCGSLEETLGQNKEVNNGVIDRLLSKSIKRKLLSGKDIGERCVFGIDCKGWVSGNGTFEILDIDCCFDDFWGGQCQEKVKDWAGVGYCPNECKGRAAASGGTCPLKEEGEACNVHEDCVGMGSGTYDMACCDGTCTQKVKDWAGVGYCPSECKGRAAASGGTCPLKEVDESCNVHEDCKGMGWGTYDVACCKGTCQKKKKDWAGVGYCPHECKNCGWLWCKAGTC